MSAITYDQFEQVDIRIGTVVNVQEFPKVKKPAYKVTVDFGGDLGLRTTSAQITQNYNLDNLIGKQVLGVVNFPPKNIAGFMSEFLLLGFADANNHISLATTDLPVPNGQKLH